MTPGYGHRRHDVSPPFETQVVSIVPPGHRCFIPFSFLLLLFFFPFCHSPFPLPFRFVVFRLSLVSPSSITFSLPCSSRWRILLFCLGDTPPTRCVRVCMCADFPCALTSFLRSCCLFSLSFFSSFPFSISILDVVCFILFSCVGTILSPRFRFLLRLV